MKNLARKSTILLLGVALELTMLAAPLAGTVYAEEKPPAIHDMDKGQAAEIKDHNGQIGRDERHDRDDDHDRDHGRDWRPDRDHDRDWHRDGDRFGRWDRWAFERRMAMYRQWRLANQAAIVNQSPVTAVMSAANVLGFDVNSDTFTLLSQNANQAVVQVAHGGGTFSVTLNNANGMWTVAEMVQV